MPSACSTDSGGSVTVPTVTKLDRVERCVGTVRSGRRTGARCPTRADTTLNGRALCRQHLAQALAPAMGDCPVYRREDTVRAVEALAAHDRQRDDLLRELLSLLRTAVPDPTTGDRLALAVVPTALIGRIEELLEGEE